MSKRVHDITTFICVPPHKPGHASSSILFVYNSVCFEFRRKSNVHKFCDQNYIICTMTNITQQQCTDKIKSIFACCVVSPVTIVMYFISNRLSTEKIASAFQANSYSLHQPNHLHFRQLTCSWRRSDKSTQIAWNHISQSFFKSHHE